MSVGGGAHGSNALGSNEIRVRVSASEVTTLWRYTNMLIIIIIIKEGNEWPPTNLQDTMNWVIW